MRLFARLALALLVLATLPTLAAAQTPVLGSERLYFEECAPDLATVQAYEFKVYIDQPAAPAGTGTLATTTCAAATVTVTCPAGSTAFTCSTPFPASTPGIHNTPGLQVTATRVSGTVRAESLRSTALPFVLVVAPFVPTNLRIQ